MRTLNCKRVAQFIALQVAGDLEGRRAREVRAHLDVCAECRQLAEEYSTSSGLLAEACLPPEFGEEFYSGIRSAVLEKIGRDRMRSRPARVRRRWVYATAFAVGIIVAGVIFQHFRHSSSVANEQANVPPASHQPISEESSGPARASLPQSPELPRKPRSPRPAGRVELVRSEQFPAASGSQQIESAVRPVVLASLDAPLSSGLATSSQVARIEIQTSNPNIRIIWLSQRESYPSEEIKHDQDQQEDGDRK